MRKYMNENNLPLSIAVFLATDNYDHDDQTISATQLIKPLRQLILAERVPPEESVVDVNNLINSRLGTAIHDAIDASWKQNYNQALTDLGYPERVINRIQVNPEPHELSEDSIPVYMEVRKYREIDGVTISEKFDFCAEGMVEDFKSTSVFSYMGNTKNKDYILQGSIYRWLNPKTITQDQMRIHFIFMDWQKVRAITEQDYPSNRIETKTFPLMSLDETEAWIRNKLNNYARYRNAPESEIPLCNDEDLWRKDPEWKYYKNPEKMSRSTKNFKISDFGSPSAAQGAAYERLHKDGNVGIVVEKPGEVVACKYCPAFSVCSQKDALITDGSLKL